MEIEYWWLLVLPLFFALGWFAARIDIKQLLLESRALPMGYFKGLNFLLNEQPDKAIEAFIEVVKVDPQTIELHFALGGLFRRRGEVERAIRMHQNLVERPDLASGQKLAALFELAQDYFKAGLLDRAEELFLKLETTSYAEQALRFLLEPEALRLVAASRPDRARLAPLRKALDDMAAAHESGDGAAFMEANYRYRDAWTALVPNERLVRAIQLYADHVRYLRAFTLDDASVRAGVLKRLKQLAAALAAGPTR